MHLGKYSQQKGTRGTRREQINFENRKALEGRIREGHEFHSCHQSLDSTPALAAEVRSFHSYRSASTGSSFEARTAGTIPLITPTTSNTIPERNTVISEIRR